MLSNNATTISLSSVLFFILTRIWSTFTIVDCHALPFQCTNSLFVLMFHYTLHVVTFAVTETVFVCRIHVRRTDKVGSEAAFHAVDEYMVHVDDYFTQLEMSQKVEKRRVYVASDDPGVLNEIKERLVLIFTQRSCILNLVG